LQQRFLGVTIYELDATGAIQQRYDAAEAQWQGQGWILRHGICHRFDASGTFSGLPDAFVERRLHFPERPAEISAVRRQPEELGLWDIRDYGRHLARQGIHTPLYEVEFHGRLAFAAVCMMMAGCGLPLALHSNRQGGTIRAVALTLLGGFSYWMLHALAMALGQNGHLPPVLAAWSANGCFGAGSLYLAARLR
jgi:lipopolysaccharide export system permease protein